MTKPTILLWTAFLAASTSLHAEGLDSAEVRISYGELKQLLARAVPAAKPETPNPALLSARLKLSMENDRPVIDAMFRTMSFANEVALIPLISGDISLETQEPADAAVVTDGGSLCLATDKPGTRTLQLRLLPVQNRNGFSLSLPACPSVIFETGELSAGHSVVLESDGKDKTLAASRIIPLPNTSQTLAVRILDSRETREALRPPEPSNWTWQHQALVRPSDSDLIYQVIARASAGDGSGVEALLPLPPDAQDVTVAGEDLASSLRIRGENRSLGIALVWKTRGTLDRQVAISYRMPLRPLDPTWRLQAPGGEGTHTRFIIAASPLLAYTAHGLSGSLSPTGLPASFAESLKGNTCHHLEAGPAADLTVTAIPVAATAEGVVKNAEWSIKIESDGAMLAIGNMAIEHKSPLGFVLDTPEGMKLLSCEVGGKPVSPVDLGGGLLKVTLTPSGESSRLTCSFTGSTTALDPVEGTVKLSLPKTPLFIHSLLWRLELPAGYQAETHGNLKRAQFAANDPPARITLAKNLCRDERPEIQVFYQRSDLNR